MAKPITQKIKILLYLAGKKNVELAAYMGLTPQSLQNKMLRGSFSADDLIKISAFTNSELAYTIKDTKLVLDTSCIRPKE